MIYLFMNTFFHLHKLILGHNRSQLPLYIHIPVYRAEIDQQE